MYDKYASQGVKFVLVVGQNGWQWPATSSDAKGYKQDYGYQSGWYAVADPNWSSTESVIYDPAGTLPAFAVVDGTGKIRFISDSWNGLSSAESTIKTILNGG